MLYYKYFNSTNTANMTNITIKNQYEFCEDIFAQIIDYAKPLDKCSRKKCNFVATETCEFCDDVCCKKCMVDDTKPAICRKCEMRGAKRCVEDCGKFAIERCHRCSANLCADCAHFGDECDRYFCEECNNS